MNSERTDVEWLIHRELHRDAESLREAFLLGFLARERNALPTLLEKDESLLAVAHAALGWLRPGVLAVTDTRALHVYWMRLARRFAITDVPFYRVKAVEAGVSLGAAELLIRCEGRPRTYHFPIFAGAERARELEESMRRALGRFDFRTGNTGRWTSDGAW